ncbi:efflux RND transporter periplasmic adaptor subunit [Nocardioides daejeonensis]|uniref:efflux RND transporter periplasmic adaptor subunit n=1 Tax=Nocardioides daejeonensis TaxID=1046556 RepID=UPI0013A57D72|nr:HlyD family efflux transporter periplasmic adaptor subunit [Nocardioides daejeonensis]
MPARLRVRLPRLRHRWWIAAAVLVLVAGLGVTRLVGDEEQGTATVMASATLSSLRATVTGSGTLEARRQEELAFAGSGTVSAVLVEAGDEVTRGQVIARLDPTALQAEYDAAVARVAAAEATVADSASGDATRVAADRSALVAARADRASAAAALEGAVLRAPYGGTVTSVGFAAGEQVGSGAAPTDETSAAVTVVDTSRYRVSATVAAAQIDQVERGQQAEVTVTGASEAVQATVTRVGRVATISSSGAAQYGVELRVAKDVTGLYVGSSAAVAIVVGDEGEALTVPTAAIRTDADGGSYVLLADGDRRSVQTGSVRGAQTEIVDGLSEGERVRLASRQGGRGSDGRQQPGGFPAGDPPAGFPEMPGGMPEGGVPQSSPGDTR